MEKNQKTNFQRLDALDAFRGFAILTMIMSSWITFSGLPGWMFHAQIYDPQKAGLTWVDLVFPFFIFSMGVAIPLSLWRKIEKGSSTAEIIRKACHRFIFLLAFSIYNAHFQPGYIAAPDLFLQTPQGTLQWLFGLSGFVLMFGIWGVFPGRSSLSSKTMILIRLACIVIAGILISLVSYTGENTGFTLFRNNIILHILATLAFTGTLFWYFTRHHYWARWSVVLGLFIWRMFAVTDTIPFLKEALSSTRVPFLAGWIESLSNNWPEKLRFLADFSWLTHPEHLQYLQILLPATIAGDILYRWMNGSSSLLNWKWSKRKTLSLALLLLSFIPLQLTLLYGRYLVSAWVLTPLFIILTWTFIAKAEHPALKMIQKFFLLGSILLILGLIFEPLEGGIRKEPVTVSYFYLTAGLSFITLSAFILLVDILRIPFGFKLLIDNGKNPMIAYCGDTNFFTPIIQLAGLGELIFLQWFTTGWIGSLRVILVIGSISLMVRFFTRKNIYLKS